jgi:hypothetical protein
MIPQMLIKARLTHLQFSKNAAAKLGEPQFTAA